MAQPKDWLSQEIEFLKGVGPSRGETLRKEIQIHTFEDLLLHFPFRYIDKTEIKPITNVTAQDDVVQIRGQLIDIKEVQGKKKRLEGWLSDGTDKIKLVWFQQIKYIVKAILPGKNYLVFGRVNSFKGQLSIVHPEMELYSVEKMAQKPRLEAVYSSTEKLSNKGLDAKGIRKLILNLFEKFSPVAINETLPEYLIQKLKLASRYQALRWIHIPTSPAQLRQARIRLKFEELFFIQLKILFRRQLHELNYRGNNFELVGSYFNDFYSHHLPFELTGAQKRVLKEIRSDVGSSRHMNRLLQGDVGSGKTVVSVMTMLLALDNGFQSCLLAPTEVLARQHFESISQLLAPLDTKVSFLSGAVKGKERQAVLVDLASGKTNIIVGTHAILEPKVIFNNLGLAITDEQHRFGVKQRAALWKKGRTLPPHILVMTATPIPRTLAMTLYGDLQVSIIDELPPGRKHIKTLHKRDGHRMQLIEFMRQQITEGKQVFVVYPLIEESAKLDLQNLMDGYEELTEYFPIPEYRIAVVHGKLSSAEKDSEMKRFATGKAHIMVATTVIEVGVNVPNASVMVIENAERFGLSQLHQLRGRVGRGADQSYCVLMTGKQLSKDAMKRMKTMCETNDGFKIAEVDLEIRGPGDIEGTQQSGILDLKMANLATDGRIIETARNLILRILEKDPNLTRPENITLYQFIRANIKDIPWGKIS